VTLKAQIALKAQRARLLWAGLQCSNGQNETDLGPDTKMAAAHWRRPDRRSTLWAFSAYCAFCVPAV